jgi:hypothetical protein
MIAAPPMNDKIVTTVSEEICSHSSQDSLINLILSPDCRVLIAFFIDTHISKSESHIAIWLYGHIAIFWKYDYTAN